MLIQTFSIFSIIVILTTCSSRSSAQWKLEQMTGKDRQGKVIYRAKPIDKQFRNPWPAEYEREFQTRARYIIKEQAKMKSVRNNTYFENEKRSYGYTMSHVLGKDADEAMKSLMSEDAQAKDWHKHTKGIDYYACFTLKHQMRKYFYFGNLMTPDYRKRMYDGAKLWTQKDPMRRPHHSYDKPKPGWGPDARNSWVDIRNTENLFLMRVTSVYLMAEETGNKKTTKIYKQIILKYASALYRIGIGEWDSENYHGHSIGPLCNLYDFANDADVKLAAKACLDWFMAAGAVKYYRGGFNGPGSRDYNHAQPFGGSAANMLWIYFGDTPRSNTHWESDEVHLITSAYRPPVAVMKLARKEFRKPIEIFSSKPRYNATTTADLKSSPQYLETQYIANTYQLGSLNCGTPPGVSSVNGFKIIVKDRKNGCHMLHATPGGDPNFAGSPVYQKGKVSTQNRVAQYKNIAIWLAKDGKSPWLWVIPKKTKVRKVKNITFYELDETWVAIHPVGIDNFKINHSLIKQASVGKKAKFKDHLVLSAKGNAKNFCGMVVHIGDKQSHRNFKEFQNQVLLAKLDISKLEQGIVQYKTQDDKALGFHWQDNQNNLGVWRNGKRHDWQKHAQYLYRVGDIISPSPPIFSKWGDGKLYVEVGNSTFSCEVDQDGKVKFSQGKSK